MRRRSLLIIFVIILAIVITLLVSGRLSAPEGGQSSGFKDGDSVSLTGELVCLPHRDQSGPQTMECAYGFRETGSGTYYAVEDTSGDYSMISSVPMNQPVHIQGIYRTNTDTRYAQNGTIQASSITE